MTKQEKIREGVAKVIKNDRIFLQDERFYLAECAEDILIYLHSKGVVIKVDREPLKNPNRALVISVDEHPEKTWDVAHSFGWRDGWACGRDDNIKTGYVAVEDLI